MRKDYKSMLSGILVLVLCITLLTSSTEAQKSAGDVIKEMQKQYEVLKSFESEFIQIEEWLFSETQDTLSGSMVHLKEDYFSVSTGTKTLMTDGEKVWELDLLEEQLVIDFMDDSEDSFLLKNYMFDFPKRFITVDFREEAREGNPGYFISLEPKNPDEETIIALEVWIDAADFIVKMARYTDFNDNIAVFILKDFKPNVNVSPDKFKPEIPEGMNVKIIDLTKGEE